MRDFLYIVLTGTNITAKISITVNVINTVVIAGEAQSRKPFLSKPNIRHMQEEVKPVIPKQMWVNFETFPGKMLRSS